MPEKPDTLLGFPIVYLEPDDEARISALWRKTLNRELNLLFGLPGDACTSAAVISPSLMANDVVEIMRRISEGLPRVFYQTNDYIPITNRKGDMVMFHYVSPDVWLLHPTNLPVFEDAVRSCGCVPEPVDRDWWAEYHRKELLKTPIIIGNRGQ